MSRVRLTSSFVEKYRNWQKIVRQNNGLWGTFLQLFRLVFRTITGRTPIKNLSDGTTH